MTTLDKMQTTDFFKAHLKKYGLTGFGGYKITTKYNDKGELKKTLGMVLRDWTNVITKDNYEDYILTKWVDKATGQISYNKPHSFYIKTGKDVGYIGIDFDTKIAYDAFITANPECSNYFTQRTKKGFHIVFNYDERLNHSCDNSKHEKQEFKIDFRSNGGCLISYPTKYYHHETKEEYVYDIFIDGELGTVTDAMIKYFDDNKVEYAATSTEAKNKKEKTLSNVNDSPISTARTFTPINDANDANEYWELLKNGVKKDLKRTTWLQITGWCVNHITKEQYLNWIDDAWKQEADVLWDDFAKKPIKIPLQFVEKLVRKKNYTYYISWCVEYKKYLKLDVLDKGSNDVAANMQDHLKDTLVLSGDTWYEFHNCTGLWRTTKDPDAIIITTIQKAIDLSKSCILYVKNKEEDPDKLKQLAEKEKKYYQHYKDVTKSSYVSQIKKYLKTYLRDYAFASKLDCLTYKIAFRNGIVDLKTNTFTAGLKKSDFLTKTCSFDYVKPEEKDTNTVKSTLRKICNCSDEHLDYYLSALGYAMTGDSQKEQAFWYIVGQSAANGKSLIFEALETIIPEYVCKASHTFLDKGQDLKKEIATWSGLRILWCNELSTNKKDEDVVKSIGDGTTMKYNKMYANAEKMNIGFKLFVVSNNSFNCKTDGGIKRRLRIQELTSQFLEDEKLISEEKRVFLADKKLGEKLCGKLKMALLDLIFEYSKAYCVEEKLKPYPADWKTEQAETCAINNEFEEWFLETFKLSAEGSVSKVKMEQELQETKFKYMKILNIKDEMKRMKIAVEYKSQIRDKNGKKGVFVGLELIPVKQTNENTTEEKEEF